MDHDAPDGVDTGDEDPVVDADSVVDEASFDRELAAYRARNIAAFLDGDEPVGPYSADPEALLLLDTRDVSDGGTRSTLVFHLVDGGGIVAFSSHRVSPKPTWHDDVTAHPHATVHRWEQGELVRFDVLAEPVDGSAADALFPAVLRVQPAWEEYGSGQDFPLVRLHRVAPVDAGQAERPEPVPREGRPDEGDREQETPAAVPLLRRLISRWTMSGQER